jgi:hypothetical protein
MNIIIKIKLEHSFGIDSFIALKKAIRNINKKILRKILTAITFAITLTNTRVFNFKKSFDKKTLACLRSNL